VTLVDVAPPARDATSAPPSRCRGLRWVAGILVALVFLAGGAIVVAAYYYDGVEVPMPGKVNDSLAVVPMADLPLLVANAFVAAVDPDFYESDDGTALTSSLITRRYMVIASGIGAGAESSWRTRIMAGKFEDVYTREEILGFYLNSADYGRGAVGLVAAARTYFHKSAAQLTVAEAALLAVQLDPDRPALKAGWERVLDTMVERGWLSQADRKKLTLPAGL
jgi:membrane carboxypeptidase/penicillin-binding protein